MNPIPFLVATGFLILIATVMRNHSIPYNDASVKIKIFKSNMTEILEQLKVFRVSSNILRISCKMGFHNSVTEVGHLLINVTSTENMILADSSLMYFNNLEGKDVPICLLQTLAINPSSIVHNTSSLPVMIDTDKREYTIHGTISVKSYNALVLNYFKSAHDSNNVFQNNIYVVYHCSETLLGKDRCLIDTETIII